MARAIEKQALLIRSTQPEVRSSRRTIDVAVELDRAREMLQPLLGRAGVRMDVSVRRTRLLRIEMRPEDFHHLICILVRNSLEWLQRVRRPRIRIVARPRGEACELRFVDNGPGIAPQLAARVFEPQFSGREGGRGMGLTIARTIVEAGRAEIDVMPRRGRGAVVRVVLPRKRARATTDSR
jgi:signal transduction histidine kinase